MRTAYIDDDQALVAFCQSLQCKEWIGVDTEFIREKTYYPELALIQISSDEEIACIDPYKIGSYTPLIEIFANANIVKIFHSPSQDLELFAQKFNQVPQNIFDTQLAAALMGIGNQIGYADLVNHICQIRLDKLHTRTNWSQRPLTNSELDYAMDDVRYLGEIYLQLSERLNALDRLDWLNSDFAAMSDMASYQTDWDNLWKKLKGVQKLRGSALHIAGQLVQWREKKAQKRNIPKRWVLKDEDIVDLARLHPKNTQDFSQLRSLNAKFVQKHDAEILDLIEQAQDIPKALWPKHEKYKSLSERQHIMADCLMAICRLKALQNEISLSFITNKKEIDKLVLGKTSSLTRGWRKQMVGDDCQRFLQGELTVKVDHQEVVIV